MSKRIDELIKIYQFIETMIFRFQYILNISTIQIV